MIRCVCGIDERTCMREQQRAQSADPCDARLDERIAEEGFCCPWCGAGTLHEDGFAPDEASGDLICEECHDALLARQALGITVCPDCGESTHATESDDTGRCAKCRACYYCDAEATRDGIHRWDEDTTATIRVCEQCGDDGDRAQRLHERLVREERI